VRLIGSMRAYVGRGRRSGVSAGYIAIAGDVNVTRATLIATAGRDDVTRQRRASSRRITTPTSFRDRDQSSGCVVILVGRPSARHGGLLAAWQSVGSAKNSRCSVRSSRFLATLDNWAIPVFGSMVATRAHLAACWPRARHEVARRELYPGGRHLLAAWSACCRLRWGCCR